MAAKRADTVKSYLVNHGIRGDFVTAEGHGKANPVKECANTERSQLIACLAPNRRVEVLVTSLKTMPAGR